MNITGDTAEEYRRKESQSLVAFFAEYYRDKLKLPYWGALVYDARMYAKLLDESLLLRYRDEDEQVRAAFTVHKLKTNCASITQLCADTGFEDNAVILLLMFINRAACRVRVVPVDAKLVDALTRAGFERIARLTGTDVYFRDAQKAEVKSEQ
jgi:hypothetical protein